jgi:alkanesulfonate monooxygenase SsuD/methylene tetrahydromethanopterin reductase-like flavin-dependent oxidoreductase (luciferase family)
MPDPTHEIAYSVLDLAPITANGGTAAVAFRNALDLARHAERWGYKRFWLAEHHNIPGVASAATSVAIGYVAGSTTTIRVGAGGIMLPNHAPLVIAEQFGTLESLYPGRIDLGLGRAPGGDQATARAIPGEGLNVPIYLLGSSDFSALLAAQLGLPFAFASHFAPEYLLHALHLYRSNFKPSDALAEPYAMVGVNVFTADTDDEARRLFTSLQQAFLNLSRGVPGPIPPPVDRMAWNLQEQSHVQRMTRVSAVGSPATVRASLEQLIDESAADELIVTAQIYDHAARLRSFELTASVFGEMNGARRIVAGPHQGEGQRSTATATK